MKIPNINCKHYTEFGKCKINKGFLGFYKLCPLSNDFSITCKKMLKYTRKPIKYITKEENN